MMLQLVTNDGTKVIESEQFMEDSWDYDAALRGIAYARVLNRVNHEPGFSTRGDIPACIDDEIRKMVHRT